MKQKFKLPKTDRLLGISAMIISLLTLIIFTYQTHIIDKKNKLSVKPSLHIDAHQEDIIRLTDTTITIKYTVTNKGLGPAIIHSSTLNYQNEDYPLDFDEFIMKKFPLINEYSSTLNSSPIIKSTIISAGETKDIFTFKITMKDSYKLPNNYFDFNDLIFAN